jgi:hypothetical protein
MLSQRRIARSLAALLAITLMQGFSGIQAPASFAAAGSVGPTTASGTCESNVGETTYVTATFNSAGFCLLQISTSTTWTVPTGVTAIDVLVVGGGGGGGNDGGGGGGGGEVRQATGVSVTAGNTSTITVGNGGAGKTLSGASSDGGQSSIVVSGTTITANGGLKSVNWQTAAYYAPGGSGGSGGTQLTGGTDFSKGGRNSVQNDGFAAGGYGTVGYAGVTTSFTGTSTTFAGGGGGGICTNNKFEANFGGLAGGAGGGGRGAFHTQGVGSDAGQPGTDGLGGGGGGGSACNDGGIDGTNARTNGGNGGKGVVYIKYVPAITFTSTPTSQNLVLGTSVSLTATPKGTISGPTRTKQWQVLVPGGSWANIAGQNSDTYSLGALTRGVHGNQYRYVVTDTLGTMVSQTISTPVTITTFPPLQGETDSAMTGSSTKFAYSSDFSKVMPGTVSLYSMQAWVKPSASCDTTYFCTIFSNTYSFYFTIYDGKVAYIIGSGASWCDGGAFTYPTNTFVKSGQWSHIGFVRNGANVKIYINGALKSDITSGCNPTTQTASSSAFGIGYTSGFDRYFYGSIDDARIWSTDRSANMASDMNSNETSTSGLMHYWNFNESTGSVAYDQVRGRESINDLTMNSAAAWDSDVVATTTYDGAYTVETFYKSYLTAIGGFKMPARSTRALALVVAGGGGGGGGLQGGGGGAGGFLETTTSLVSGAIYPVTVGVGGVGGGGYAYRSTAPSNGTNSVAFGMTAFGGGFGASEYASPNEHWGAASGGSGGGGTWGNTSANYVGKNGTAGQGNKGGDNLTQCCIGAGGGGAGGVGGNTSVSAGGVGGVGKLSLITGTLLAGGGGGAFRDSTAGGLGGDGGGGASATSRTAATHKTGGAQAGGASTGGGGGGSLRNNSNTDGFGANGGSGIVAIRWITASKPTFTPPTTAYLNAGMTETFTTNVAQDSATVSLTRTFRWESSTTGVNGTYSVIKQGTGANNAFFAWVPANTSTSGSTYAYRVVVTDSDSSGLFIVDTSTPVWAIINQPLNVSGNSAIAKAINVSRNETFTITLGTSTYRSTLTPDAPGISLDTSTAGFAVIRIAETATVGTYYETLTVTDSVSASVTIPLTINVAAPPNLINSSEITSDNLIYHLDAGNSASLLLGDTATATNAVWRDISGNGKHAQTSGTYDTGGYAKTCAAPVWSPNNGGHLVFDGSSTCYWSPYIGEQLDMNVSVEVWMRLDGTTLTTNSILVQQNYNTAIAANVNYVLGDTNGGGQIRFGIYDGGAYRQTTGFTPTRNAWTHIVGTYNGSNFKLYKDGVLIDTSALYTAGLGSTLNFAGTLIGRRGSSANHFNGSLATVRIYDKALTDSQVLQNYNATKDRFLTAGAVQTTFSQKYGSNQSESYTVTSGFGSKTTTFTVGDRTGIDWDTQTASTVVLNIQDSLTVGTYLDTATVTDSLGQSTYLPIRLTVTKADTITVTLRNPKVLTYTGSAAASLPDIGFTGLKNSDTATVIRLYSAPASAIGAPETYSALVNGSSVPIDVESYTVSLGTISFNVGSLSNYEGVVYETSTLRILQAEQPDLRLPPYGAVVGVPYTFVVEGGAGGGAITESVTAGSTASGCSITNRVLTMSSTFQSYCSVLITKAQSRNFKGETLTAQIYFYSFVINQPSAQAGSGPNIALNGATSVTLDSNQAPTISALSATTISLSSGGSLTISGAGFTTSPITVKFWRNKEVTVTSTNGTTLVIPFSAIGASGATSGRIIVTTPNGQAVSVDTLTINP